MVFNFPYLKLSIKAPIKHHIGHPLGSNTVLILHLHNINSQNTNNIIPEYSYKRLHG